MVVYAFEHLECIHESAFYVVSLHKTKQGAYKAMREDLIYRYNDWRNSNLMYGHEPICMRFKFGESQRWRVKEMAVIK